MTTNQRIKQLRQELKLSQAKFAKAISISNGYIAGIELGNRNVNDRIIRLICLTFNVREEWLRSGEGRMFEEQPTSSQLASSIFQELKPEYQEYILSQINQLLDIQSKEEKCKK